jgi:hypothetical protein
VAPRSFFYDPTKSKSASPEKLVELATFCGAKRNPLRDSLYFWLTTAAWTCLQYLEITQQDLQREFRLALSHPRHLAPSRTSSSASPPRADLAGLIDSLSVAQHVLEIFRRGLAEDSARCLLGRLARRLVKILADATKLNAPQK